MFDFNREPGRQVRDNTILEDTGREPLMTVITPYYNAGKYIRQTFQSVIDQTFPWFEWLIIDDGSTEKEQIQILKELCALDSRIKVIRKENGGIASARNTGIQNSSSEILVMLDADDLIVPTYLEVLYWMLYKNPDCDWAYTNTVGFQDQQYLWDKPFRLKDLKKDNFLTYSAAIRKEAAESAGLYNDSEKYYYEDWDLWLRFLQKGKRPVKSSLYGFWYRRHDAGVLGKINGDKEIKRRALRLIQEEAKKIENDEISAKEFPRHAGVNRFETLTESDWTYPAVKRKGKYQILMIVPWMRMGGSEIFELEILKNIDRQLFGITVLTTVDAPLEWRQRYEEYTDDIFELPSFLDMKNYPEFISYVIKSREIRLVLITNSYYGYCLMPWLRMKYPDLAILDYVHMEEWYWRRGGYARISSSMREITEHTYVCSEHTKNVLIEVFGRKPEEITTLYIGVDPDYFHPDKIDIGECYRKLRIPADKKIILYPCRMDPQKRPFLMLEIAEEAMRRNLNVVFVAAGEGPLLPQLREKSIKKGLRDVVFFIGQVEDLRPYYKDAVITLNCSIQEGLAITSYESCAMRVPVISADVGGQGELIDDETGKLLPVYQNNERDFGNAAYDRQEVNQYVDALEELLGDRERYHVISGNCRKKITDRFSTKSMIKKTERIFIYYIENQEIAVLRKKKAEILRKVPSLVEELMVLYHEVEGRDTLYHSSLIDDKKNELLRIAESKWGRRLIQLLFKIRLNKIWR